MTVSASGLIYLGLVVVLGVLYFVQQRMVAARAAVSPTMSPSQQKLMQYLPVAFAVFQVFFVLGLVIYYISQAILRIGLQHYITRRSTGTTRPSGAKPSGPVSTLARLAKQDGDADGGGGGLFAQARRDLGASKADRAAKAAGVATAAAATAAVVSSTSTPRPTKRTTEPKNRPTPSGKGPAGRPQKGASRPGGPRSKSSGKRQR